jgi:hypothetical protein
VQETLNTLLDEEADRLCNAKRYERTEARKCLTEVEKILEADCDFLVDLSKYGRNEFLGRNYK